MRVQHGGIVYIHENVIFEVGFMSLFETVLRQRQVGGE